MVFVVIIYLSRLLGERRLSQAELSRRTGIRPNTIHEMYHGTVERLNLDHLDRICEVLDCELGELLIRTPNSLLRTGKELILNPHQSRNPENDIC